MAMSRCNQAVRLTVILFTVCSCEMGFFEERDVLSGRGVGAESKALVSIAGDVKPDDIAIWIAGSRDTTFSFVRGGSIVAEFPKPDVATVYLAGNLGWEPMSVGSVAPRLDTLTFDISKMRRDYLSLLGSMETVLLPGSNSTSAILTRGVAKISVGSVRNGISTGPYAGKPIVLDRIFVINGVGRYRPFASSASAKFSPSGGRWWFAPSGIDVADESGLLGSIPSGDSFMAAPSLSLVTIGKTIVYGATEDVSASVYTGPNDTTEDVFADDEEFPYGVIGTWQVRKTRLVLQCTIDGLTCYYPVTVDRIAENTHYYIKLLSLEHIGSAAPDLPYTFLEGAALIKATPWENKSVNELI